MLNYDIRTPSGESDLEEYDIHGNGVAPNPFPGLRPFSIDECHLFFGREGQVDEVLVKLAENRFVTVMGYSGSGKSSLMYCGLVPILYGGFMTDVGANWNVITSRPGVAPIDNLAASLLNSDPEIDSSVSEEELLVNKTVIASLLRSNSHGLVEAIEKRFKKHGENTFILIDQFEELFRYRDDYSLFEESRAYVSLLLDACRNSSVPIYVAITMRSDYIGECAKFPGLTQLINQSNYLVPQMTRDQKRVAIEGPVAVGGGAITKRLVKRLLNEIGDNQDQLPILQHALMRTWDYWVRNRDENEPLDIRHYNAVGKITEALSLHANEAYDELSSSEREIAEILFKALTEKTNENQGLRRPARLSYVAELAGATEEEVAKVVEKFRQPGRSFLMPPSNVPLQSDSIIEISHESLMRIWTRLKVWVDEEYESAQMYRRLSEAAAMYQIGRTGLWRPPDLQLALNWQKKQKPTRTWAQRYDEAFERAIVFLDTSRITYEAEQKNQEMLQRRLLKRTKIVAVVLGISTVISII
ncbi:ABC transporter ATP-binding protein, partial [Fulvivirga aurantia]|uniref:ATP-binding cassette domain-containing protein n=1 Tax=Fulvivirga aurantia TaxID=2529383 RepID=UPI00162620A3